MKKKTVKGFTLVELIVVIAIIGVLAAILVPSLSGYVRKSKLQSANANAKTAYEAVATYITDKITAGDTVTTGGTTVDATQDGSDLQHTVYLALKDKGSGAGEVFVDIATDMSLNGVQWHASSTDTLVGQYPNPATVDSMRTFGTIS